MALSLNDYTRIQKVLNWYKSGELAHDAATAELQAFNPAVADSTTNSGIAATGIDYIMSIDPIPVPAS